MPSARRPIDSFLSRSTIAPHELWRARLGVGFLMAFAGIEGVIFVSTATMLGFIGPTVLVGLMFAAVVAMLAFAYRTGRWRVAVQATITMASAYVVMLNVVVGAGDPAVAVSTAALIAGATTLLGSRWTWPLYGMFVVLYAGFGFQAWSGGAEPAAELHRFVVMSMSLGVIAVLFWLVETERARASEQLRQQGAVEAEAAAARQVAHARGVFLATMSHEIRTPMNAVLNLQRMLAETDLTADQRTLLDTTLESSKSLLQVLNDVLDFSKIEASQLGLESVSFDTTHLVDSVVRLFRASAAEKRVELRREVAADFVPCRQGDPARLRQVLSNLLSNAIKFTDRGFIAVRVSNGDNDGIRIEVTDCGIGIAADKLEGLFEPFTQADASTTRRYGGTGLGLAISQRLCRAMGGEIRATSTPGTGSTFTVELPLPTTETPLPAVAPSVANPSSLPPLHVLVAEDHPTNQVVMQHLLRKLQLSFEIVSDGRQAVERVAEGGVDLVLMDIHMPVLDGHEASRAIRALPGPEAQVPIVAVSASTMASDRAACRDAGMNDHLGKPVRLERLRELIAARATHGTRSVQPGPKPELPPPGPEAGGAGGPPAGPA